ncbi:hypothetical protein GYN24_04180 [Lactococcus piscium]|uniref:hypothetical protein n=1 Tax=Pseudolactococcus paracarnosus TaxID=2749962 RepID=UPI001FBA825B|nr:hypothetical protein [Lactococcus paracarnosus]MCJ1993775.1 hypothetical protein [Lactococcus paracarnosus]
MEITQEENKHKLQEVAFDISVSIESFARGISNAEADLQEAKTSAKKLIEKIDEYLESQKPKFEVGDYVTVDVNGNGRKKIAKIDALMENKEEAHGLWYDKTKVNVKQDYWFLAELNEFRHATPTEIAEYESALSFHEHGRKPFELKWGDLIKDSNSNRVVVVNPYIYIKGMFYKSGYELLATVEEVDEWLGADAERLNSSKEKA